MNRISNSFFTIINSLKLKSLLKKAINILIILMTCILYSNNICSAWNEYQTGEIDTVLFDDYIIYLYLGRCNTMGVISGIEIIRDSKTIIKHEDCSVWFYHFCGNEIDYSYDCLFKDINSDGIPEVMINDYLGGQGCCHNVFIYSLGDSVKLIDDLHADHAIAELKDIDGDSIPEFLCTDIVFKWWKGRKSFIPGPPLIWKWDGSKFKIANFRFSRYALKEKSNVINMDLKSYTPDFEGMIYDSVANEFDFPPSELLGKMLAYIYAGQPEKADSVLNDFWPDTVPGKDLFYRDFKRQLESGLHWQDILKSDW